MSVSMLEADFQCKETIENNNVFAERRLNLFCLSASIASKSGCLIDPLLARTTEMTPINWSVSQQ